MARDSHRTTRLGDHVSDAIDEDVLRSTDPREYDSTPATPMRHKQQDEVGRPDQRSPRQSVPNPEANR